MNGPHRFTWAVLASAWLAGCPDDSATRPASPQRSVPLTAVSTGAGLAGAATTTSQAAAPRPEEQTIVKTVEAAMRAGLERHDLAGYMAIWAADAKLVLAREQAQGPYDITLTRAQIEATKKVRFSVAPPKPFAMEFADAEVTITGGRATMTWLVAIDQRGMDEQVAERYELRKTDEGWKVTLNRYWPVRTSYEGQTTHYDGATWQRLDAAVATAKQGGDDRKAMTALAAAYRFVEAHAQAKRITVQAGATAADWQTRSAMALLAGDAADGRASRARAVQP